MYSTTWCGVCQKAKAYFNQNRISYTEYDVENSTKGKQDFQRMGGKGVPIILVGNKRMNGFSQASFEQLFNK
jgi:glutaredoxin